VNPETGKEITNIRMPGSLNFSEFAAASQRAQESRGMGKETRAHGREAASHASIRATRWTQGEHLLTAHVEPHDSAMRLSCIDLCHRAALPVFPDSVHLSTGLRTLVERMALSHDLLQNAIN
jgi:hypothetical protein